MQKSTALKTALVALAAALAGIAAADIDALNQHDEILLLVAGLIGGWAGIKRPGDVKAEKAREPESATQEPPDRWPPPPASGPVALLLLAFVALSQQSCAAAPPTTGPCTVTDFATMELKAQECERAVATECPQYKRGTCSKERGAACPECPAVERCARWFEQRCAS